MLGNSFNESLPTPIGQHD